MAKNYESKNPAGKKKKKLNQDDDDYMAESKTKPAKKSQYVKKNEAKQNAMYRYANGDMQGQHLGEYTSNFLLGAEIDIFAFFWPRAGLPDSFRRLNPPNEPSFLPASAQLEYQPEYLATGFFLIL